MTNYQCFHDFIFTSGLPLEMQSSEMLLVCGFQFKITEFTHLEKTNYTVICMDVLDKSKYKDDDHFGGQDEIRGSRLCCVM